MTTINQARAAIYEKFINDWPSQSIVTPFTFPNETFDSTELNEPWVRVSVNNTDANQETLGPKGLRKYRREGTIYIQCFDLSNNGLKTLDEIAANARGIFEGETFDGVYVDDSVIRESGPDGRWFMVVVSCFFHYNQTK
jgi:hypothetical protein